MPPPPQVIRWRHSTASNVVFEGHSKPHFRQINFILLPPIRNTQGNPRRPIFHRRQGRFQSLPDLHTSFSNHLVFSGLRIKDERSELIGEIYSLIAFKSRIAMKAYPYDRSASQPHSSLADSAVCFYKFARGVGHSSPSQIHETFSRSPFGFT